MATEAEAEALANLMVEIGRGVGRKVAAIIADMNQPLGNAVGNALEVIEVMEVLTSGDASTPLAEVTTALGGALLTRAGIAADHRRQMPVSEALHGFEVAAVAAGHQRPHLIQKALGHHGVHPPVDAFV